MQRRPTSFLRYALGVIVRPGGTLRTLSGDPRGVRHGLYATLCIGVMYTVTVELLARNHSPIFAPPLLRIPEQEYYAWERYFVIPLLLLSWCSVSACVRLCARALGGQGTFEGDAAVSGMVFAVPMLVTWLPETCAGVLYSAGLLTPAEWIAISQRPGFWSVFSALYQWVWLGWQVALALIGVRAAESLSWPRAGCAALAGFACFAALMAVFIR